MEVKLRTKVTSKYTVLQNPPPKVKEEVKEEVKKEKE